MTPFQPFGWDLTRIPASLQALEALLGPPTNELREREDILPFFKAHPDLCSLIGTWNPHLPHPNVVRSEFEFFGDHACDLAIGQMSVGQFCFVEFEDARPDSVFRPQKKGRPADWGARLEHGFGQILDWFRLLEDMRNTARFETQFGHRAADYIGLLVIGRRALLAPDEAERLRWRSKNILVTGRRVECLTFDDLFDWLRVRSKVVLP